MLKSWQFRVESKEHWFFPWYTEWSFDTPEEALAFIQFRSKNEEVIYVSK